MSELKSKHSISETTRKVFFPALHNIRKAPSGFFSQNNSITAKGLYPPSIFLFKSLIISSNIPTQSSSVPIKLITMPIESPKMITSLSNSTPLEAISSTTPTTPTPKRSKSTPSSTIPKEEPLVPVLGNFKQPTLIDQLITKGKATKTVKASRPSASTRTASQASTQTKTSTSIKLTHKKPKKQSSPPLTPIDREIEEDVPITKPITLTEKRKRQAKRADQIKIWKVREEREAREARSLIRRNMMNGLTSKKPLTPEPSTILKKKKKVKFNFDRNFTIELPIDNTTEE